MGCGRGQGGSRRGLGLGGAWGQGSKKRARSGRKLRGLGGGWYLDGVGV